MAHDKPYYPRPSIVIGIGDFGLSCLEQLGENWVSRNESGGDSSLRNLRLIHISDDENAHSDESNAHSDDDTAELQKQAQRLSSTDSTLSRQKREKK